MKDGFDLPELRLACSFLPSARVFFFEECASTNTLAKEWAKGGNAGTALFAAAAQSAGRGRMGRSFYSPQGSGIYFTLVKTFSSSVRANPVGVTCAAAVAVMRGILEICGLQCEIKWVNDLLYKGKKVCGILTEALTCGEQTAILVGVGINLRPEAFPPELEGIAGSLNDEKTPRAALIAALAERLNDVLEDPLPEKWIADYRLHSCVLGRCVVFQREGISTEGIAAQITGDGGLLVRTASGDEILRTGEITLRLI